MLAPQRRAAVVKWVRRNGGARAADLAIDFGE
jgi:hypothetical protein